jgi:hypothetical protein
MVLKPCYSMEKVMLWRNSKFAKFERRTHSCNPCWSSSVISPYRRPCHAVVFSTLGAPAPQILEWASPQEERGQAADYIEASIKSLILDTHSPEHSWCDAILFEHLGSLFDSASPHHTISSPAGFFMDIVSRLPEGRCLTASDLERGGGLNSQIPRRVGQFQCPPFYSASSSSGCRW